MRKKNKILTISRFKRVFVELASITLILLFVFSFRSSVFEPYKIPSGSMLPTLYIGDFILVNKFAYGFKLPFSEFAKKPIFLSGGNSPTYGDVIIFKYPKDTKLDYVKRIVALPGDRISIKNNKILLNNKFVDWNIDNNKEFQSIMVKRYKRLHLQLIHENLNNYNHHILVDDNVLSNKDMVEVVVPKNHYFVMGDNRNYSIDSRSWGFVPRENIKGKAMFVWLSLNLPIFSDYEYKFRPGRFGREIK